MSGVDFKPGAVIEVGHPFVRDTFGGYDEAGPFERPTWKPGIRYEPVGPETTAAFADAMGKQTLTVISVHKPGKFPTRIFYTRQWEDPDGKQFGNSKLLIKTAAAFRTIVGGYRVPFELTTPAVSHLADAKHGGA